MSVCRWYRERGGRLQPAGAGGAGGAGGADGVADGWAWGGGAARCLRASPGAAGLWICKAYNVFGDATAHTTLHVLDTLSVTVTPTVLVSTRATRRTSLRYSISKKFDISGPAPLITNVLDS